MLIRESDDGFSTATTRQCAGSDDGLWRRVRAFASRRRVARALE